MSKKRRDTAIPIYEYRCGVCGKISEFLVIRTDQRVRPRCKRCKSKKVSRILSRVRVGRSEESRLEGLADPSKWGDIDERDPKSMARWMKRMGKELGEDGEGLEGAFEEEMASPSGEEPLD